MKAITLLILSISFLKINGQIIDPTFDILANDINKIRLTQTDTCISIRLPDHFFTHADSLPGIGEVVTYVVEYLIYKTGQKTFSKKYVLYDAEKKGSTIAVSYPVETNADTIFSFLKKSMDQINNEEIYPYIYQFKNPNKPTLNYAVLQEDHPTVHSIGIFTSKKYFYKSVNWRSLQEKEISGTINLNYKANIDTELNSLYKLLLDFIDRTNKLYTFKE